MTTQAPAETLLAEAMERYQEDPAQGDFLIQYACAQAPNPLPLLRIGYKFYNRQRRFEQARNLAARALAEAAHQAGMNMEFEHWTRAQWAAIDAEVASHALLALKALAFLALRDGHEVAARPYLDSLLRLDLEDGSGASVVEALLHAEG